MYIYMCMYKYVYTYKYVYLYVWGGKHGANLRNVSHSCGENGVSWLLKGFLKRDLPYKQKIYIVVCEYIFICICVYRYINIHEHTCIHTHIHVYTYVLRRMCTHVCAWVTTVCVYMHDTCELLNNNAKELYDTVEWRNCIIQAKESHCRVGPLSSRVKERNLE